MANLKMHIGSAATHAKKRKAGELGRAKRVTITSGKNGPISKPLELWCYTLPDGSQFCIENPVDTTKKAGEDAAKKAGAGKGNKKKLKYKLGPRGPIKPVDN